jgi:hypothetical protein
MSHIVEVRQIGREVAEAMAAMRIWLDHNGIEIATFGHSQGGPGITFRLAFVAEDAAKAFAKAFHGRVKKGVYPGANHFGK